MAPLKRGDGPSRALRDSWERAKAEPDASIERIRALATSRNYRSRLLALAVMRKQIDAGHPPAEYFALARSMIRDSVNSCRWQSVIVVSESISTNPDAVWEVVCEFADSRDEDMRAAIACVLLEELLEEDFTTYFPRIRGEVLRGRTRVLDTLDMCWFDDRSGPNYRKAQSFVRNRRRGASGG